VGPVPTALDGLSVLGVATFGAAPFCCTHLGAELAEERAAEGRGHEGREVEHGEAVERGGHEAHV